MNSQQSPITLSFVQVIAVSRADYSKEAEEIGVKYFSSMDDFAEEHPDVVILASSILSTKKVLESLPLLRFKRSTLFVDVLSVKVFPKQLLLNHLPAEMDIVCTHPMFGPDSGRDTWKGLNFQYEMVRINPGADRESRAKRFIEVCTFSFCGHGFLLAHERDSSVPSQSPECCNTVFRHACARKELAHSTTHDVLPPWHAVGHANTLLLGCSTRTAL